jgi:phosphoribosyl-ATP pyrophosphohydrolase/phosphoribosyl-AMP cyclohydrolase
MTVKAAPTFNPASVNWPADGLVPAVVQDVLDGRVLMVAYMDREALGATLATGDVHFHSRSRGRLWKKGETSGNVLRLRAVSADCDGDALLITANPVGPTCHRGERSCFDPDGTNAQRGQGFAWLESLWATIAERAATRPEGSYTAKLLSGGVDAVGRKVTEEATEVLLAAKNLEVAGSGAGAPEANLRADFVGEAGDLLYHLLVLLAERDVPPAEVIEVLERRHGG